MSDDWRPTATREALIRRSEVLAAVRTFFAARDVLEVETPALAAAPATDPHLAAMSCRFRGPAADDGRTLYLQTSPEFAMKRLLAAGSGPIFQICRAFRDGEAGRRHNPEFTILEWYRPGWDHTRLMDEVDELLGAVLATPPADRVTYGELFERFVGLDPYSADAAHVAERAATLGVVAEGLAGAGRDDWLGLLFAALIEPRLGHDRPVFVTHYPASQAALARVRPGTPSVAERFEVYVRGVELANGYHELVDSVEQRRRCVADLEERRLRGLPAVPLDQRLLAALESGMPESAGVALGVDRLVMLALGAESLAEVWSFPVDRA